MLREQYTKELRDNFGIVFNELFTITNMPIARFRRDLERRGHYERYMEKLAGAFNPAAATNVMCRDLISVDHDGRVFDCDFNQMLDLPCEGEPSVFDLSGEKLAALPIRFASHCFGCTAGAGSSCGGATA